MFQDLLSLKKNDMRLLPEVFHVKNKLYVKDT